MAQREEVVPSKEMARSEEMTRSEAVAQSEEMAATRLNLTVTHNNEKHDLYVTPQQGTSEPTVQDLAQLVEEATGVPLPFQKLIFKGKSLKEMEQPLSVLGIQNGCRVMLIGKKNSPEEEVELKKLKDLEKAVEKIANQLEELSKDFAGIQQDSKNPRLVGSNSGLKHTNGHQDDAGMGDISFCCTWGCHESEMTAANNSNNHKHVKRNFI
ncbi:BAG family molecular chaperone regulator 1 isoform X3 [Loxodonta africana]|uniref:BAG family molecular chaperone regulator 1 isoform X3 n=1 Tax=Loxodonta africana TaxID=9785 RepID=UPI0030CCB0A8